jgi:hypothetical protein
VPEIGTIGFWKKLAQPLHERAAAAADQLPEDEQLPGLQQGPGQRHDRRPDDREDRRDLHVGNATPRNQMILAQLTALKTEPGDHAAPGLERADPVPPEHLPQRDGQRGRHRGRDAFFGTSTPTIGQVVNAVESRWTGNLTTNRNDWNWNLTNAQKDMIIQVLSGINQGNLILSPGC